MQPSKCGRCSYFLDPDKLDVETVLLRLLGANPTTGLGTVVVDVKVGEDIVEEDEEVVEGELCAVCSVSLFIVDGEEHRGDFGVEVAALVPNGLRDENRLEARFAPFGGGVHVRLIFSNGMEHSESDEDE